MMAFLIGAGLVCVAFYYFFYRRMGYQSRLVFKSVLLGVTLLGTAASVFAFVWSIRESFGLEQDKTLAGRLSHVEYCANAAQYTDMAFWLNNDMDYEPEFDRMWERLQMYACRNRYLIYAAAEERESCGGEFAGKAESWRQELIRLCTQPECPENEAFGMSFLQKIP